jgi:phage terminase large subunit-like protein
VCRQTKDTIAGGTGELISLRDWQSDLIGDLLAAGTDKRRLHRRALIGVPRKNGKSALSASIALADLFFTGPHGGEVYSCAADRDQARIVFGMAKRMVELEDGMADMAKVYRDAIEVPSTGSVYRVLSAEAFTKEGLNPSLTIFDEVHAQPNDELWNVMSLAGGSRVQPLLVGITTAGLITDRRGDPTLCHRLYDYGKRVAAGEVDDKSFFFRWWAAPDDADWQNPDVWAQANPGFDDIVAAEDFESSAKSTPENEYRTKRLNQWVTSKQVWLPEALWSALGVVDRPDDGARVVFGFDGSYSGDSTALIGCTVPDEGELPVLWVEGLWERQAGDADDWRVPVDEVMATVADAMGRFQVAELACDPSLWRSELEQWEAMWGDVVMRIPPTTARMAPACNRFYSAVADGMVTHDGDPVLARHLANAVTKVTPQGTTIVKDGKSSPRKIDAAIAAVMAHDRAMWHSRQAGPKPLGAWV